MTLTPPRERRARPRRGLAAIPAFAAISLLGSGIAVGHVALKLAMETSVQADVDIAALFAPQLRAGVTFDAKSQAALIKRPLVVESAIFRQDITARDFYSDHGGDATVQWVIDHLDVSLSPDEKVMHVELSGIAPYEVRDAEAVLGAVVDTYRNHFTLEEALRLRELDEDRGQTTPAIK